MNVARPDGRVCARGFSLVEVLIAVLILGVGLLGLGAVFPVVISQQQRAGDVVVGSIASTAAEDYFLSGAGIVELITAQDGTDTDPVPGSNYSDAQWDFGTNNPNAPVEYTYLWETDWDWSNNDTNMALERYRDTGHLICTPLGGNNTPDFPVASRLYPAPGSGLEPRFVWDFIPRRTFEGDIEIAIFVRRVDLRINPGNGEALIETLQATMPTRLPVGFDFGRNRATGNGTQSYSVPLALRADVVDNFGVDDAAGDEARLPSQRGAVVYLSGDGVGNQSGFDTLTTREEYIRFLARPNQRFVDNLGVVRRVIGYAEDINGVPFDRDGDGVQDCILVDPPYNRSQSRMAQNPTITILDDLNGMDEDVLRANTLRQVVFTPQTPASVTVRRIGR